MVCDISDTLSTHFGLVYEITSAVQAAGYKTVPFMAVLLWLLNISFLTNRMRH